MLCFNIKFVYFPESFWLCLFSTILTKNSNFWPFLKLNSLYWWKIDKVKKVLTKWKVWVLKLFFHPSCAAKAQKLIVVGCSKLSLCKVKIFFFKFFSRIVAFWCLFMANNSQKIKKMHILIKSNLSSNLLFMSKTNSFIILMFFHLISFHNSEKSKK